MVPALRLTALFTALLVVTAMAPAVQAQSGIRSWLAPFSSGADSAGEGGGIGSSLAAPGGGVGTQRRISDPSADDSLGAAPGPGDPAPGEPDDPATFAAPSAMGRLVLSARYGERAAAISGNLHWRIFPARPDSTGQIRLIKEERGASPTFVLPAGSYVVHVGMGLANAARRVMVGADTVNEVFDLPVGGVRIAGHVGNTRIPGNQVSFEIYSGSQFDPGEKRPIASDIAAGQVVLLPEGTYHVVSKYGDGNAVMRYDMRVTAARLTDARINHRAAVITLKLVSDYGGEAIANTAWSVLTPGGDVIKESIGAFPTVVLGEGEYVALARNDGRVFHREFKVETGVDREIEVLSR